VNNFLKNELQIGIVDKILKERKVGVMEDGIVS